MARAFSWEGMFSYTCVRTPSISARRCDIETAVPRQLPCSRDLSIPLATNGGEISIQ